jgi:hypothetical protein
LRGVLKSNNLEIEQFLHFKSEIRNLRLDDPSNMTLGLSNLRFLISDLKCRNCSISKSSNFKIP